MSDRSQTNTVLHSDKGLAVSPPLFIPIAELNLCVSRANLAKYWKLKIKLAQGSMTKRISKANALRSSNTEIALFGASL